MLQNNKKRNQGFTIIEVLIVLAIAGLIMLIVFLAVPALRRNSNNTASRNDASKILSAVSESVTNNNGKLPDDEATNDATLAASANTKQKIIVVDKFAGVAAADLDQVQVVKQVKCKGGSNSTTGTIAELTADKNDDLVEGGTSRDYAVIYNIDSSGGKYTNQCLSN